MGRYILRAVKYFIKLMILLAIIFALILWSKTTTLSPEGFFTKCFCFLKGQLFSVVIVVWCALYPKIEYVTRRLNIDPEAHRGRIIEAMHAAGFTLSKEQNGEMIFRADSPFRRIMQLWEDEVTLTPDAEGFTLSGTRRNLSEAEHRIRLYTENRE